jgi:serine/alanine adding enzyme
VVDIRVITGSDDDGWLPAVDVSGEARLAHATEWFTVIKRAYGHDPLYLAACSDEGCAVLPAFVVRRPLFGTVVTSMPFLDSGGPCGASPAVTPLLVDRLIAEAWRRNARMVELRCANRLPIDTEPLDSKVNMTLALDGDAGALWRRLEKGVRNQIRRAERSGLHVEFGGPAYLPAFYDTFVERMRDLGSPVHALAFLGAVVDGFGPRARVVLVKKGANTIGGLVAIAFKDRVTVPWATCLKEHFALCPNMLLYWETIRTACADGFARFDFGRSTRQSGTYHFKRQWGAQEEPLFWYRIPIGPHQSPAHSDRGADALLARMWQRLPLPVTRYVGPQIRRYLIQ